METLGSRLDHLGCSRDHHRRAALQRGMARLEDATSWIKVDRIVWIGLHASYVQNISNRFWGLNSRF